MPPTNALLFPGQGSHAAGMEDPYRDHPLIRRGIEVLGFDPFGRLAEGTRTQQPALFLCSMAQWASSDREEPLAAAGPSLGEYAALTASGAIDFEDALRLVDARAQAMARAAERPGGMIALLGGERDDVCQLAVELGLSIANDNAPGQLVLSGAIEAVDEAVRRADEIGARARKLGVGGAFHSPLMAPAADALKRALDETPVTARVPRPLQRQHAPVRGHPQRACGEPPQARSLARDPARATVDGRDGLRRVRARLRAQRSRQAHAAGDCMTTRHCSTTVRAGPEGGSSR